MPAFPKITKNYINTMENKNTEFTLTDPEHFIWTEGATFNDLKNVNGYYCSSPAVEAEVMRWVQKVKKKFAELKACNPKSMAELPQFPGEVNGN
jgi:hypothetical protein